MREDSVCKLVQLDFTKSKCPDCISDSNVSREQLVGPSPLPGDNLLT